MTGLSSSEASQGQHYDEVDFTKGPKIYSREEVYDIMYQMGEFSQSVEPYRILDAMSGQGLVGKGISARLDKDGILYEMNFLDLSEKNVEKLQAESRNAKVGSVLKLPYDTKTLERIYARFGVKNYRQDQQIEIMKNFNFALTKGGIFVLCDMEIAPEAYEFMQQERRKKHSFGMEGGEPHVPTRDMWLDLFRQAGMEPKVASQTLSKVTTKEWVTSNQMTEENLREMNDFLLSAPDVAKRVLNIRRDGDDVKIDYPVVFISGYKI
jgi:ubiquinone/menaquinone biosynthesis C-methylase UbiE